MKKAKEVILELKYPVLRYLVISLYVVAGISFLGSLYMGISLLTGDYVTDIMKYIATGVVVMGSLVAIMLLVQAQLIQLFIDVEWNQREIIELQKQTIESLPEEA